MANVKLENDWNDGFYQLEATDPVIGGEDGIDNLQAKQLGTNIFYLRRNGIAKWINNITYSKYSLVNSAGELYISLVDNNKNVQVTNANCWTKLIKAASTTTTGIVKLNDATNSTSTTEAATANAVNLTMNRANSALTEAETAKTNAANAQIKADSAYNVANTANNLASTANTIANTAKSTAETDATTSAKGRVQLNSAVNSTAENQAATPKAVKTAYDLAAEAKEEAKIGSTDINNMLNEINLLNDRLIIAENKLPQTVVLYPAGSEESPPTISINQRIVIDNPFNTMNVLTTVEVKHNGIWGVAGEVKGSLYITKNTYVGISASPISTGNIVIQSAANMIIEGSARDGNPFNTKIEEVTSSMSYRVRITKLGN